MGQGASRDLNKYITAYLERGNAYSDSVEGKKAREKLFKKMDTDGSGLIEKREAETMWRTFEDAFTFSLLDQKADRSSAATALSRDEFMQLVQSSDTIEQDDCLNPEEFAILIHKVADKVKASV